MIMFTHSQQRQILLNRAKINLVISYSFLFHIHCKWSGVLISSDSSRKYDDGSILLPIQQIMLYHK